MTSVSRLRAAVFAVAAFGLAASALPARAQDANMTGRVSGTLLDEQGQPLANMKIVFRRLDDPKGKSPETTTNKKGKFNVGFFPIGTYAPELVSDDLHIDKQEYKQRAMPGASGPDLGESREGGGGTGEFDDPEKAERAAAARQQGGAGAAPKAGDEKPRFFTVKMGSITEMTLTTAKGKAAPVGAAAKAGSSESATQLKAAHDALDAGDMPAAIAAADQVLAREPDNGMAVFLKGVALARQSKMAEAVPLLRRASELVPEQKSVRTILGSALLEHAEVLQAEGKKEEAAAAYSESAEILRKEAVSANATPGTIQNAVYALGRAGRTDDAIAMLKAVVDANPTNVDFRLRYADELNRAGRKEEARKELAAIPTPLPDTLQTLRLAEGFTNAGDDEAALKVLDPVAIDSKEAASVLYNAAAGLINAGKQDLAIPALERAAAGQPDLAFIHHQLGLAYLGKERYADAVRELKEAVRLEPDGANAATDKVLIEKLEKALAAPPPKAPAKAPAAKKPAPAAPKK